MVETAIGLGLVISLMFSETLGLAAGGMVVPGYIALMVHEPLRIAGTIGTALLTLLALRLLSRRILIYGLRRIVMAVLIGFSLGALSRQLATPEIQGVALDLSAVGYVIPGLLAHWMERQGIVQTLCVMTTTAVLVRLLLMLIGGGELIR